MPRSRPLVLAALGLDRDGIDEEITRFTTGTALSPEPPGPPTCA